ncbi:polysaccharide lyase 6 family protein [Akkermansiaceae bacterium]|nr:polysaccharide lyase 6 family protein [Akkermansiaceae bacterium]
MKSRHENVSIFLAFALTISQSWADVIGPVTTIQGLNASISAAKPGDTILMANGIWTDTVITFDADGRAGEPITLRAQIDGQVKMEGASRLKFAGDHLVVQGLHFQNGSIADGGHVIEFRGSSSNLANHCRLTECAITNYNPSDPTVNYKWVSVYGMHNRVDHCSFIGMNHIGVTLTVWLGTNAPANHTRIDNNYFGEHAEGDGNGFETIRIGTSTRSMQESRTIVEENYFYKCDGEIEIISNKSIGNIFRRNTFESCKGQLTLRHGNECVVEGNYFIGNGVERTSGVRVIGEDHSVINNYFENLRGTSARAALSFYNGVPNSPLNRYFQVKRALIAFNTFSGCTENFVIGIDSDDTSLPPLDCVVANNIIEGDDAPLIEYRTTPINMDYEGNIFHGASLGISQPSGIQITDPLLVPYSDGTMRPASNSPVIDHAEGSYPDISTDIDGQSRPTGSADIGADELSTQSPLYGRLNSELTGPRWMRASHVTITETALNGNTAVITFEDLTGLSPYYAVERSSDLENWTFVGSVTPVNYSSTVFQVTDSSPGPEKNFWRVRYLR